MLIIPFFLSSLVPFPRLPILCLFSYYFCWQPVFPFTILLICLFLSFHISLFFYSCLPVFLDTKFILHQLYFSPVLFFAFSLFHLILLSTPLHIHQSFAPFSLSLLFLSSRIPSLSSVSFTFHLSYFCLISFFISFCSQPVSTFSIPLLLLSFTFIPLLLDIKFCLEQFPLLPILFSLLSLGFIYVYYFSLTFSLAFL